MNIATVSPLPIPEPEVQVIEVTPDLAQRWLGLNTSNRALKNHAVLAYAMDMKEGRWRLNGEAVKFAGSSKDPIKLLDGQNRLHAVLKSRTTVRMLVVFGLDDDAQITMDSGAKRTVADNLQINLIPNGVIRAAAASLALHVDANRIAGGMRFTNATVQAFVAAHPALGDSALLASQVARRTDVAPAMVAYTHWILAQIDAEMAYAFWRDAAEKTGLAAGDPVIALTNRFAESRRSRESIPRAAQLSMIYRAWNARRSGKSLQILKMNSSKGGLISIPDPR